MASSSTTGAPAPEPPLLAVDDLACRRGGRLVFEGLSFALAAGEALELRGPNGSGKSSLLRVLAGLIQSVQGQTLWSGDPIAADPVGHRSRLHYIAGADALKASLTVSENLHFAVALAGTPQRQRLDLADFDLER